MKENDNGAGAMVPAPRGSGDSLVPPEWLGGKVTAQLVTRIDQSSQEGKSQVFRLMTESGRPVEDVLNLPIKVTNYLMSPAQFTDKVTGEDVATVVTRLVLADDSWVETHSVGVLKTLSLLVSQFGDAPWHPPLEVTLRRKPLRDGRSWVVIELTPAAPAATKKR